jgi:hypothetical protein
MHSLRKKKTRSMFLISILLCFAFIPMALGQMITGDIIGTVTDPSGAAIPGATVTVTNTGTQLTRKTETNSIGDYSLTLLQTGTYSISIEATGFKVYRLAEMSLSSAQRARVNARLEVGNITETIEVSAAEPLLQTDSSSVSSLLTSESIQEIPLNGRNFIDLVTIQPGVNAGTPGSIQSGSRPDERRQSSSFSANGQLESRNSQMLDGMDNTERYYGLVMVRPGIDGIAEVRVDTNAFSAESGRSGGAVVNLITKSGSNQFHGTLFEFLRNDIFDATEFFNSMAGKPKPKYRQNQFGGSIGGPIIKNKTFFFFDIEQYRIVRGTPSGLLTVPTKYQLDNPGDFSDIGGPVLSPSQIDPVGLGFFELYPEPNILGAGATNNYFSSPVQRENNTTMDVRIDHHFSSNDTFFGRYSRNQLSSKFPSFFPDKNGTNGVGAGFIAGGTFPGTNDTLAQGVQLNYTHVFSPQLLMELRTGFSRISIQSLPYHYGTNIGNKMGVANANYDQYSSGMPSLHFDSGAVDLGDQIAIPILNISNTYQYNGTVTYNRGSHNMRMGAALVRRQLNYLQEGTPSGWFWFTGLPELLKGTPWMIQRRNQLKYQYLREYEPNAWFQDDWRATPWLTLNLGLRWDVFTPWVEKNYERANFNPAILDMILATANDATAGIKADYKDFAPRFGFSAQLGHNMVLRGGYGLAYFPADYAFGIQMTNIPFAPVDFSCLIFPFFSTCPAGIGTLAQGPPIPTVGDRNNYTLSGGVSGQQLNRKQSYLQNYNLFLQKQFGENVINLGFAGSLSLHVPGSVDLNQPAPSTGAPNPKVYATQLPQVTSINYSDWGWNSNYNSMQLAFARRFSKGLAFNANYTWAHSMSYQGETPRGNRRYNYGNTTIDIRHRFAVSGNYELPFGKSFNGLKGVVVKGWAIASVAYWQTGMPFGVVDGAFRPAMINIPDVNTDRPDKVVGQDYVADNWTIDNYINLKAFKVQAKGTPGSEGVNQLTGPPTRELDLSLFKAFSIREDMKLQFRWEVYNVTNTANLAVPVNTFVAVDANGNPTSAGNFGKILSSRIGAIPRQMQFALKLAF